MKWAKVKYGILKEKGLWNAPTREEQQFFAMKAEINDIKKFKENERGSKNGNKNNQTKDSNPQKGKPDWMYQEPPTYELEKLKTLEKIQMVAVWPQDRWKV